MQRGMDFLKSQVANAAMQHETFLESLIDHEKQAEDPRFRDLCSKYIPMMREHQRSLDDYARQIGADKGGAKKMLGKALELAKGLADAARESDHLRLVEDIVMARQSEDTFKTFREAGKMLGNQQLQQIGDQGERGHDEYVRDANRLVQQIFVEHVRGTTASEVGATTTARSTTPRSDEPRPSL